MGGKTSYTESEQRIRELAEDAAGDTRLEERLQVSTRELEKKDLLLEESFSKLHASVMEKELARIELNQIFNTSTDGMWIVDNHFNVIKITTCFAGFSAKMHSTPSARSVLIYSMVPCVAATTVR